MNVRNLQVKAQQSHHSLHQLAKKKQGLQVEAETGETITETGETITETAETITETETAETTIIIR
jgi:hypothetical protein